MNAFQLVVAPMMDWTDRHCRSFHRILSPNAVLYSEMVTAAAIRHGKRDQLLAFDNREHPVVLQLGGSDPAMLAEAALVGQQYGYDEINLNCGCPSDRVQAGRFGACLMAEPALVAECVAAMREAVSIPVTVKTRIGIDDSEGYDFVAAFIDAVRGAGCETFIIHARKAWLSGLSPRENREVPPLDYEVPYRLKREFPNLSIIVNGGITTLKDIETHRPHVDGVMIGREAYQNPAFLSQAEAMLNGGTALSRMDAIMAYRPYVAAQLEQGVRLHAMTRHLLGLFNHQRGGRAWRRFISENATREGAGLAILDEAIALVSTNSLEQAA